MKEPRISPLQETEWPEEARETLESLRRDGVVYNIFATLARHPKLLNRWLVFGNHILSKSSLPPRDRELAILRVGYLCRANYEWGHHVVIGKQVGLSQADIERVVKGPDAAGWEPFESQIIRAVDELHANSNVSESTWGAIAERYTTEQQLDFLFTVGQYKMVSLVLNTTGIELEPGFENLPNEIEG